MDKSSVALDRLTQEFEMSNKAEGKSPKTVDKYNWVLGVFKNYLDDGGNLPRRRT